MKIARINPNTDIMMLAESVMAGIIKTGNQYQDEKRILYHAMKARDLEAFYLSNGGIVWINPDNQQVIFEY